MFDLCLLALQSSIGVTTFSVKMSAVTTHLLRFLLVAAVGTAACLVLMQQQRSTFPFPFTCGRVGVPAAAHGEQQPAAMGNGTTHQQADDPSTKKQPVMLDAGSLPEDKADDKLPEVLRRAAMEDNTVIMTFMNQAWTANGSLMDLFLESFRTGVRTAPLLAHLVIVAVDGHAFERCRQVHPHCYALPVVNNNGSAAADEYASEQRFMAKDYLRMMWRRNRFQARVLELGYSFVFTDMDILWFRNPLLRIPVAADVALACDFYRGGNPYDLDKGANGGFLYARAGPRAAAFYRSWYEAAAAYPGQHEQFVFDKVKAELSARHGVTVHLVDTIYLGTLCDKRRRDFLKLCTFHANCLVGLKPKVETLRRVLDEWQTFKAKAGPKGTALTY